MRAVGRQCQHERPRAPGAHRPAPGAEAPSGVTARADLAEALIDSDPDAIFVVTETGRVCFANAAARAPFAGGPLRASGDRLGAADPGEDQLLGRALAAARSGCASTFSLTADGGPARVDVAPLGSGALAAVRVIDPAARLERALAAVTMRCGLTPSEASLARALAKGVLAPEHARRRGVAISTVRSQAQNLLRKTGARSQVEFLAQLRSEAA